MAIRRLSQEETMVKALTRSGRNMSVPTIYIFETTVKYVFVLQEQIGTGRGFSANILLFVNGHYGAICPRTGPGVERTKIWSCGDIHGADRQAWSSSTTRTGGTAPATPTRMRRGG